MYANLKCIPQEGSSNWGAPQHKYIRWFSAQEQFQSC